MLKVGVEMDWRHVQSAELQLQMRVLQSQPRQLSYVYLLQPRAHCPIYSNGN
jgi:hypothetical protein